MRRKSSLGASLALGTDWELATGYWALIFLAKVPNNAMISDHQTIASLMPHFQL